MDAVGLFTEARLEADAAEHRRSSTRPDWFSFVVAVLAGTAGMLSLTSAKSGRPGRAWPSP